MKVVILAGGHGTRIRDVSDNIPKPMIPIGGFPILWHIMKYYAHWGHKEFILCLGYQGQVVKDFFLAYEAHTNDFTVTLGRNSSIQYHSNHHEEGWKVTLADTGLKSMTGARVQRIRRYIEGDENFLLTYGDGVSDINLQALIDFHLSHGKIMTISGVYPPGRFGELTSGSFGKVHTFNEKPQASGGWISGGFFLCRKEFFQYLNDREDLVLEQAPMRKLVKDGQMMVYEHTGFWQCMDTHRDYLFLNELCSKGEAPWQIWQ